MKGVDPNSECAWCVLVVGGGKSAITWHDEREEAELHAHRMEPKLDRGEVVYVLRAHMIGGDT